MPYQYFCMQKRPPFFADLLSCILYMYLYAFLYAAPMIFILFRPKTKNLTADLSPVRFSFVTDTAVISR